jgi:hypothetical protein
MRIFDALASSSDGSLVDIGKVIERARQYAGSRGQHLN